MMCAAAASDTSRYHDNVFEEYSDDLETSSVIDEEKNTVIIASSFRGTISIPYFVIE